MWNDDAELAALTAGVDLGARLGLTPSNFGVPQSSGCAPPLIPSPSDPTACIEHSCPSGYQPDSFARAGGSPHVCVPIQPGPGPGPGPSKAKKAFPWLLVGAAGAAAAFLITRR